MKNLKIRQEVHTKLKKYCDDNHLKMSEWVSGVIDEYIDMRVEQDKIVEKFLEGRKDG